MRLLTWNIHKGIGGRDRAYRLQRIVDAIAHEAPDICCLQEVDRNVKRSRHDDQPKLLGAALGLPNAAFQLNHRVGSHSRGGYGNLVLSRNPMEQWHNVSLRFNGRKNRRALVVVVQTTAGPLRLVNWHLGLSERERQWQVGKLLDHRLYQAYQGLPTMIAGDFNDWRDTLHPALSGLRQVSSPSSRFRTFPAYMPVGALDKVFCCDRVNVLKARIVHSVLTRRASDHLPLVIDFELA